MKKKLRLNLRNASIPTSSFADIAFLLIVFFLLTTFIAMTKGIHYKPQSTTGDKTPPQPSIHLFINEQGNLIIDGRSAKISDIKPYLMSKLTVNPNKPVIIHCSLNQEYQKMMEILDQVKILESEMYDTFNAGKPFERQKHIKIYIPSAGEMNM